MKIKFSKKKQKGIAERKTEVKRKQDIPFKAIGLGLLLWLSITWLFFGRGVIPQINIADGERIPATVEAQVDFECENLQETALARKQEAGKVAPVFTIDPLPVQRSTKKIQALFERLAQYAATSESDRPVIINSINDLLLGSNVETSSLIADFPADSIEPTKNLVVQGLRQIMGAGILSDGYRESLTDENPERLISILPGADAPRRTISLKDVYSTRTAVWAITEKIEDQAQRDLLDKLLLSMVVDNMTFDKATTEVSKREAAEQVAPVMQSYPAGSILARAGEPATQQTVLLLRQHAQKRLDSREGLEQILEILGNGTLLLAGLIAATIILRVGNPKLIREIDKILLLVLLSLLTLGTARLLTFLSIQYPEIAPFTIYLVPHALAIMLAGILLGGSAAIGLGFWTSFATAVLFDQSFTVFALGMLITITAASSARNVHRRSSLFRAGLWICLVKVLIVLVSGILKRPSMVSLMGQIMAAILSAIIATILTLLLIPLFEKLFKITTDITLLELSDMGHPLLQKMAMQAPGTYHHSLMVATLAQNAAEAIGANSLLVRVSAYYHDIGKMAKPEFFTENIQHKENPHDELSPHMSALVISSHVKEGLTLAKRHKLPQPILDAIEQHHGNGLISFFYHKAKTQAGDGTANMAELINDSDFRYGGAPAVSPEMAILSLADASEAASRSIEKPTPQKISNLLDDIFAMKIRDGQMDYANLTMAEIKVVKQSFIFSLSNMLHGRIPYPKDNENKHPKPTEKPSDSDTTAQAAD
jgi:putative nucleotidyltransferase with HDIG domain